MQTVTDRLRPSSARWDVFVGIACLWLAMLPGTACAQSVPALINYQGHILNPDGSTPPTADYELSLSIFDSAEGVTQVWGPQTFNGTSGPGFGGKVPIVKGYFNVMIGPVDTANRAISMAFTNSPRFLEIKVGTNAPILPRQQILSAPFAFNSSKLAGKDWSSILVAGNDPETNFIRGSAVQPQGITTAHLSPDLAIDALIPPGTVIAWASNIGPKGWYHCNGARISRTEDRRLFEVIGTIHGAGDGSSTFNLPDYRGLFLRGVDSGSGQDPDRDLRMPMNPGGLAGSKVGTVQLDALQVHSHESSIGYVQHAGELRAPGRVVEAAYYLAGVGTISYGTQFPAVADVTTTAGTSPETRPKNAYVYFFIKR